MPPKNTVNPPNSGSVPYGVLVGKVIEAERSRVGLSQAQVAAKLSISQSAYSKLENGQNGMTLGQLREVAQTLGASPHKFVAEADKLAEKLVAQHVGVPNEKEIDKGALLIGLGLLFVLLSRG